MGRKIGIGLSTVGLLVTVLSAWYLMRGPFMGTGLPPTANLLASISILIVGLLLLRSGLNSVIHHSGETERVIISNKKV
jgi:hypothetical protein